MAVLSNVVFLVAAELAKHSEFFREMLPNGYVKLDQVTEEVDYCHRMGWVYSSQDPLDPALTRYTFPSRKRVLET